MTSLKKGKKLFIFMIIIALFSSILLIISIQNKCKCKNLATKKINSSLKLFDLSKPTIDLVYRNISCRKSAKYMVETSICLNDIKIDYVSKIIWADGVYEKENIGILIYFGQ